MANVKKEIKEGSANQAEAEITPGVEPNPEDISHAHNTGSNAEIKEGRENEAEAKTDKARRVKEAEKKESVNIPYDVNAANRRISQLLQGKETELNREYLANQVRKLKNENAMLKQQIAQLSSQKA